MAKRLSSSASALSPALYALVVTMSCLVAAPAMALMPRQMPYYDVEWAKSLTLEDMNVQEMLRRTADNGVEMIWYRFQAFEQPFALHNGSIVTVPWRQAGTLCLPPVSPEAMAAVHQAVLANIHDYAPRDVLNGTIYDWCTQVSAAFGIPVFIHGWERNFLEEATGLGYHELQFLEAENLMNSGITRSWELPMDGRYIYDGVPLVRGDMVAITFAQRAVEAEWGALVDEVGAYGSSKEGQSLWVASALDDRIAVLAPGGSYVHNPSQILDHYEEDWDCRFPNPSMPTQHLWTIWRLLDYMNQTSAGRALREAFATSYFKSDVMARHVLVSGDLGWTLPHQHDSVYPILGENEFFENFAHPSWRYVRVPQGSGIRKGGESASYVSLLPHVAELLVDGTTTPTTPVLDVYQWGRTIRVRATSTIDPNVPILPRLLYAFSDERSLRLDTTQWLVAEMVEIDQDGNTVTYESPWITVPGFGQSITFIASINERARRGSISYLRSASSLPQERLGRPKHSCNMPDWD